ncbi:MAG TPA: NAD(P)/FAD-dependent oxidoreductase [Candidatus Limnocylindrales bacterium]|jgi:thioredoxin reductase (NADPH)|nr:NAD(P)/FAD-dependent oxidoreductase [Candidatus Limnocylindrales bacterium]
MLKPESAEVIVVGGGLAGLSAAIYLGRAKRPTLVIDAGKSMARWEPDVQNYLGFPKGISGTKLIERARKQARLYGVRFRRDQISWARVRKDRFSLRGSQTFYTCRRLLLATGIFHLPPEIPGVKACLGHSLFFCKDCDGYRLQGQRIAIYGWTGEAVEYALAMLVYSDQVVIVTDGRVRRWSAQSARWIREYQIPVYQEPVKRLRRKGSQILALEFENGRNLPLEALFTTRGDIYFNDLAKHLGAKVNANGEVVVDLEMQTTVRGLYAAGCVTPANCQMIIAAGQGAVAAQAINRDLFRKSLATHSLRRFRRRRQLRHRKQRAPVVV